MSAGWEKLDGLLSERYGVRLTYDSGVTHSLMLDAPKGMKFEESDCHVTCGLPFHGYGASVRIRWAEVRKAAEEICEMGFYPCEDSDCDVCEES